MAIGMLHVATLEKARPKLSEDLTESFDLCQNNRCTLARYEKRGPYPPPCMSGKQHIEGRRGSVHDTAPVTTGSPQPPRLLNRE
jgi:hypothetical protein